MAAVAKRTFAGWVTGSLHHNVTNIVRISGESQCDLCSDETWLLNKPGKSLMQPMKCCLPDRTAADATHSSMPGCEIFLAVNSKLVDLCV